MLTFFVIIIIIVNKGKEGLSSKWSRALLKIEICLINDVLYFVWCLALLPNNKMYFFAYLSLRLVETNNLTTYKFTYNEDNIGIF